MKVTLKSIINYLCVIPAILLIYTVFIIDNSIPKSIVMGQTFWFYKVMPLLSISVLLSYLVNNERITLSSIDFMFFFFILSGIGVTWIIAEELTPEINLLFCSLILYFLFKVLLHQKEKTFHILILSLMLTGLVEAIWGLKQLYGFTHSQHSLFKTTGSFYNPGPYAGYLAMIAPIALHYCLKYSHYLQKKLQTLYLKQYCVLALSVITLTFILIVLPVTGSRASWLAVIAGCTVVLILDQQNILLWLKNNTKKVIVYFFFIGSLLLAFAGYGLYAFKKNSADGRLLIWKNTITLIKNNPHGVGVGFYAGNYGKYQAEYFKDESRTDEEKMIAGTPEYAFNEYLQIAAEFGMIAFLLFIAIIVSTIVFAIKNGRNAPLGGLVALLVFASMSYPFSLMPFIISFLLLLTLCSYSTVDNIDNNKRTTFHTPISLFAVCAVCATVYVSILQKQLYRSYQAWGDSRYLYYVEAYASAEKLYAKEYDHLKNNVDYLFEYGQILSQQHDYNKSNAILKRAANLSSDPMIYNIIGKNHQSLREYNKAADYYTQAMNRVPHRLYPYYLLAQMYIENNDRQKAQEMAKKLLSVAIKIPSPAITQIRDEMQVFLDSFE